jgi:tetratricopeptide (TPR) repeat protein
VYHSKEIENDPLYYDKALEFKPDDHLAWYNKACSYGLQRNIEQALKNLQQAINLNPNKYREMAKTDSDFDKIRDDERFQLLIEGGSIPFLHVIARVTKWSVAIAKSLTKNCADFLKG